MLQLVYNFKDNSQRGFAFRKFREIINIHFQSSHYGQIFYSTLAASNSEKYQYTFSLLAVKIKLSYRNSRHYEQASSVRPDIGNRRNEPYYYSKEWTLLNCFGKGEKWVDITAGVSK